LRGGFDEWKRLGFPLDPVAPAVAVGATLTAIQPAQ
jgi:hypothetical protein